MTEHKIEYRSYIPNKCENIDQKNFATPGNSLCYQSLLSSHQHCLTDCLRNINYDDFYFYSLFYPTIHQSAIMLIHISHPSEIQIKSLALNQDILHYFLPIYDKCLPFLFLQWLIVTAHLSLWRLTCRCPCTWCFVYLFAIVSINCLV